MTIGNEGTDPAVPSEQEAPAPAPEEPRDLNAPEPDEGADAAPPEPEFEEIDWEDGQKYRIPKPLKKGFMLHADYTRKTQEAAARVKALEEREKAFEQQATEYRKEFGQLAAAEAQISQYGNVDWDAWEQQDPDAAHRGWRHFQQLKEFKGNLEQVLEQKSQERSAKAQQDFAKRAAETRDWAVENIKGWTPELDQQLERHAVEVLGYTRDELAQLVNPKNYRLLHRDWLQHQTSTQQQPAAKPSVPAPQAMERVATRSSPGAKRSLHDPELSMDEYVRRRRAGEKG